MGINLDRFLPAKQRSKIYLVHEILPDGGIFYTASKTPRCYLIRHIMFKD